MKAAKTDGGWALMEVAVAMALLGIVLVSICQAWLSLAGRLVRTEEVIEQGAVASAGEAGTSAWSWGTTLADARWLEGPRLQVALPAPAGSPEIRLGVWINGWLQGDYSVDNGLAEISDPLLWQAHRGEQVVVRARTVPGGWGPPCRLLVPGGEDEDGLSVASTVVVHAPSYVLTEVVARAAEAEVRASGIGCVMLELSGSPVLLSVGLLSQAIRLSGGRCVDVYF